MTAVQDEINDRFLAALARLEARQEKMEAIVRGDPADPAKPGLVLRIDRIEGLVKQLAWIGRGGLVGLAGTLILLYRILAFLAEHGVNP